MNFLAHIYLSGNDSEIKIGNFIADDLKGSSYKSYPYKIALGVTIHRTIDSFADSHSIYSKAKKRLTNKYGHYSGIVLDVFFDHFLALHWEKFSDQNFRAFRRDFYLNLVVHSTILTPRYRYMMPFMIARDWLGSYREIEKIESVLARMSRRTSLPAESLFAKEILVEYYSDFEQEFFEFMPEIIQLVEQKFEIKIFQQNKFNASDYNL
jgi:acyl carrier protein phosphodiesterase